MPRIILTALLVLPCAVGSAVAADRAAIGVAAPLSGPTALLGAQAYGGALAFAAGHDDVGLVPADTRCEAEGGRQAARSFVEARVAIAVGFLCTAAIEAAMPILAEAGIAVITSGVRTDSLTDRRDKTGWPVFRLAPRADEEAGAVARLLTRRWREELFAVIDDGTIYGRDLAEGFRLAAEQEGLKPVFTDTFRPQLENQVALAGRLRKAGATHVFAGGDRADLAILGRDAAELGYDLVIAGGEALRSARDEVDLAPGTLMVGLPEWVDVAAPSAVAAARDAGFQPEGHLLPTYAAMEVAHAALEAENGSETPLSDILSTKRFETALGEVRFNDNGDWAGTRYRLFRYDGETFREIE